MDKNDAYEKIRQQIVDEKLGPGQWLIERELCETYGLSRTPIREVLWKLAADGFIDHEPNRGFAVRKLNLEQIFEVFQMREAVEGMAARLACRRGDEAFKAGLRKIRQALDKIDIETETDKGIALGRQLHNSIMETAHNAMMTAAYEKLKNLTILTSHITKRSTAIEQMSKQAHFNIIDALLEEDEDGCERVMREHLKETCRQVVERFYPGMLNSGPTKGS